MATAVATRYARALVELATQPGATVAPERVLKELDAFVDLFQAAPALRNVLLSPAVPMAQKRALVTKLVRQLGLSDLVRRFLLVTVDRRRVNLLPAIREAAESLLDERLGVVRVDITSARQLSPSQQAALLGSLERLTGRRPRPRFSVDPELIGGLVARIGSVIYDGSIRGQLEVLKRRLAGAQA